ncbi:TolC family protein [Piscinibacter sakaiensis]|uniref:Heavy metal RND efflux outer membrane protein, CzcC family n=1 Tax=Piscinibacter sakaiensis TaxID=1547922 RepID=A0A0K8P758_PISS1|nr:TolC family protein [Piscinibacter sakaiensis]GAP38452.1 hypothetical protein ISF6_4910 [Piscinibacter sakaiensis]
MVPGPSRPAARPPRANASRAALLAGLAAGLAACGLQPLPPAGTTPPAAREWLRERTPEAPETRAALAARGLDTARWPLPRWDEAASRAWVLASHPALVQARAEWAAARATRQREAAQRGLRLRGGELALEHHADRGPGVSPWSVGVALELGDPAGVLGTSRRDAAAAAADAAADEAGLRLGEVAWALSRAVRDRRRGLWQAEGEAALHAALARTRAEQAEAWARRLALGAADAPTARAVAHDADAARRDAERAQDAVREARSALVAALGLDPTRAVLPPQDLDALADPQALAQRLDGLADTQALQEAALLDRLDLRRALARYAAADAELRLAVARQWPQLVLRPGWTWEPGDRRWTLGIALDWPLAGAAGPAIAEATARRAAEAAAFAPVQQQALADLAGAREGLERAQQRLGSWAPRIAAAEALRERSVARREAGDADRLAVLAARADVLALRLQAHAAQAEAWAAVAALEDALQRPLDARGRPLPRPLLARAADGASEGGP